MRHYFCINEGWQFIKREGDKPVNITIPHTWNAEDGQDGGNDYYRGVCVYRRKLKRADLNYPTGYRVYLEFLGVNSSAEIKVNNVKVFNHEGGYSTFRVDITDYLLEENIIEVIVDNGVNNRVYPQRADFTFYGGIYRDVNLVIVHESHFDLDYHGSTGMKVTPEVEKNDAVVKIETFIKGNYDEVKVTIDGVGTIKGRNLGIENLEGVTKDNNHMKNLKITENMAVFTIPNVHLWNGIKDPYLYEAKAELILNGEVIDEVTTKFGCRTYAFDAKQGFILNGERYPLHGVSRHQDRKGVGNALTEEMHEEDVEIILEMGANSIRLAHYQHHQYIYDLCDEKGLVVWAEIPYISQHMPEGRENTLNQMRELIVQNYNHPSIICWALSNEITLTGVTEDLLENHRQLNDLAHRMDPNRVTAMANLFMLETDSPLLNIPDIMSYNLYYGWYVGELEENDRFFDEFHEKYPDKVIGLSEYGADCVYKLQSPKPEKGDFSEQYQCVYHEHMLNMFSQRPYIWSTYLWNMFDFAADAREDADDKGVNHKGLVTFDRKIRKDAFYLYKAWWSDEPFVHLCGSRYVKRTEAITEVKVYSNFEKVTLYKDGTLFMTKEGDKVFTFQVPIEGSHTFEVRGVIENEKGSSTLISEEIKVEKVAEPNLEYFLKKEPVNNWFDEEGFEVVEGYFSIKDTLGEIKKVPEGAEIMEKIMAQMQANQGEMAKNVVVTEGMLQMLNRFTIENLLKQGAAPKEVVRMINNQLNKIKKM